MTDIAFVTTCKGRLHHLRETLPLIVAEQPAEIVVVDYACPDGAGDWVESHHPSVRVVRVTEDPGFCLPRARNFGARHSRSPWIVFIDADVKIRPGWVEWMQRGLTPAGFYRAATEDGRTDREAYGTIICPRQGFETVGGYDEAFRGWGGEDDDFYDQLRLSGFAQRTYPHRFVQPIRHSDAERTRFQSVQDVNHFALVNSVYRQIKIQLMYFSEGGGQLALDRRLSLMAGIKDRLAGWDPATGRCDFGIEVDASAPPVDAFEIRKKLTLRFSISRADVEAARKSTGRS